MPGLAKRIAGLFRKLDQLEDRLDSPVPSSGPEPERDPRHWRGGEYPLPDGPRLIHVGCGPEFFEGWINIDLDPQSSADLLLDVSQTLPFPNDSIDAIHSEDFIEHIPLESGQAFLRECYRVLKPGGWMRILTPDLRKFARNYLEQDQGQMDWYAENHRCRTHAEAFNLGMRMGGHIFLYDEETLGIELAEAGFEVVPASPNRSACTHLSGIDVRLEGISIYWDCLKPAAGA